LSLARYFARVDNGEHLLDACARLIDALLRSCPNVRVFATSRERLRIDGEYDGTGRGHAIGG